TPRNSVLVSALFYSLFVLVPLGSLVVADALLSAFALSLEFAALIQLRKTEPTLRGAFRIPLERKRVIVLALVALSIVGTLVVVSFRDGEYGVPALIGSAIGMALGVLAFGVAARKRAAAPAS